MKLKDVKYADDKRAYVEFTVKSGPKKGYVVRRFGKILACSTCGKKYFVRDEQLKKGIGKFCSIKCAKRSDKDERRKEEVSSRRSKKIKDETVYFRDDGKIYVEKKDKKGKVYRYYGEIRKCLSCGEDFFADFSQIRLDRAKFCSQRCAQLGKKESPPAIRSSERRAGLPEPRPLRKERISERPEKEIVHRYRTAENIYRRREIGSAEKRTPVGAMAFGVIFIYVAVYFLLIRTRAEALFEGSPENYIAAGCNLFLAYGLFRLKPWAGKALLFYIILIIGGAIASGSLKNLISSQNFLMTLLIALIPHVLAATYLINPEVKEQFQEPS